MATYYDNAGLRALARAEEALNPPPAILDCGHAPSEHSYWSHTYATTADGRKICHACNKAEKDSRILDCGHTPSPHSDFTSGTAHTPDGREICCTCADDEQRAELADGRTKYYGYLATRKPNPEGAGYIGNAITTWTGGVLARVTYRWTIRNGFGGKMTCWNAVDDQGNRWYGRNAGDGMATVMHRAKH